MPSGEDTDDHAIYYRRLADERLDAQVRDLSNKVNELDRKVDVLTVRIGILGAVGAVVVLVANIIGPVIAAQLLAGRL